MGKRKTYKSALMNEVVDERTGEVIRQAVVTEVIPGFIDLKVAQKGRFNNGDFITIFQNTMYRIATEANLTKGEYKLLLYLLGTAGIDNSVCTDYQILVEELGDKRPNVVKALKGLVDRNIVIRQNGYRGGNRSNTMLLPMELRVNYDQLNYDISYKGRVKDYSKIRGIHPEIEPCPQSLSLSKTDPNQLKFDFFGEEEEQKGEEEEQKRKEEEYSKLLQRLQELKEKNMEWASKNFYIDDMGIASFRGESPYEKEITELNKKIEEFLK